MAQPLYTVIKSNHGGFTSAVDALIVRGGEAEALAAYRALTGDKSDPRVVLCDCCGPAASIQTGDLFSIGYERSLAGVREYLTFSGVRVAPRVRAAHP